LYIYIKILNEFYGFDIQYDNEIITKIQHKKNNFIKFFKSKFDDRFVKIIPAKTIPKLTDLQLQEIKDNLNDLNVITKIIAPDNFKLSGLLLINKTDITDSQIISEIKKELMFKNSILDRQIIVNIQDNIRSLLKNQTVFVGIAAFHNSKILMLNSVSHKCSDVECIYRESKHIDTDDFHNSVFQQAYIEKKTLIINDFPGYIKGKTQNNFETELLKNDIKSILIRPLTTGENVIGEFFLSSSEAFAFDPINLMKLEELYPLFSLVIERALDDFDNEVQSIIRTNYTSIHPSIEWKFREAAMKMIDKHNENKQSDVEKIVFEDVYPLYCATDIRGSSVQRNTAIQSDLEEHLQLIKDILESVQTVRKLPILDEYLFRVDNYLSEIKENLSSGNELGIIGFLHNEIETCFKNLKNLNETVNEKIAHYYNVIDSNIGTLYNKRKDFDDSVDLLNKTISNYIDSVQPEAQKMYPHYFDKNTTDGIDQNIYIGSSLIGDSEFNKLYLKNLRLWQLIILSNIALLTDKIKEKQKIKLDTTHLVVVQDMPLTLMFKTDENKLAVEGAYNIRYEIMKKRIDKAVIKDTEERLTQIGKIAIVYTQNSEAVEYRQYLEFLIAKKYLIEDTIEDLLLEDLQGIKGLRALRIEINFERDVGYSSLLPQFEEFARG